MSSLKPIWATDPFVNPPKDRLLIIPKEGDKANPVSEFVNKFNKLSDEEKKSLLVEFPPPDNWKPLGFIWVYLSEEVKNDYIKAYMPRGYERHDYPFYEYDNVDKITLEGDPGTLIWFCPHCFFQTYVTDWKPEDQRTRACKECSKKVNKIRL